MACMIQVQADRGFAKVNFVADAMSVCIDVINGKPRISACVNPTSPQPTSIRLNMDPGLDDLPVFRSGLHLFIL